MQEDANLVELEKSCETHIFLQNFQFRFATAENEPAKNLQGDRKQGQADIPMEYNRRTWSSFCIV